MARGTVTLFNEAMKDFGAGIHTLPTDDLKLAVIDATITPSADDTSPTWSDYSTNEVSGTGYTAGGESLTTKTWTMEAGIATLKADDVNWAMNAAGPQDGYWGILYNGGAASDQALGFIELDGPLDMQAGPWDIEWSGGVAMELPANVLTWETP